MKSAAVGEPSDRLSSHATQVANHDPIPSPLPGSPSQPATTAAAASPVSGAHSAIVTAARAESPGRSRALPFRTPARSRAGGRASVLRSIARRAVREESSTLAAAMSVELILWLFSFASVMVLIGLTAYQLICLSDLEYDYINPYDSSSRINAVVLIEYALQGALCASFLLTLHWFPFLVMAPVTYYHVKLYLARKHLVDVTEIFRQLSGEKKYRMIKLAFYFCLFIITIYRLVMTAVMLFIDEDINLVETRTI